MTLEGIINKVLIRLREASITAVSDTAYSILMGEFVNETKREVEDAHMWNALRQTVTIPSVQGTTAYSITGSGKRSKIIEIYETTTNTYLPRGNASRMKAEIEDASQAQPHAYYIEGVDGSGDIKMHLALTPDAVYSYDIYIKIPQADLTTGVTLTIDEWPIILGTYAKALEERGEDGGNNSGRVLQMYASAVSDAIQLDLGMTQGESEWYV